MKRRIKRLLMVKYLLLIIPLILVTLVLGTIRGLPGEARMFLVALEIVFGLWLTSRSCEACGSWFTVSKKIESSYDSHIHAYRYGHIYTCLRCKHEMVREIVSKRNPDFQGF